MGEAKWKATRRAAYAHLCQPMSRERFNLFAIGARHANQPYTAEELSWWRTPDERLIAVVSRDRDDDDYLWTIIARDAVGRYRAVDLAINYKTQLLAENALIDAIARTLRTEDLDTYGRQGDEPERAIDLLAVPAGTDLTTLHPIFNNLLTTRAREAARAVIKEIGPWLTPSDPHVVREFQGKAFDQRLWELYLWAAMRESGYNLAQPEAPDFHCISPAAEFCIEAVTVTASTSGALVDRPVLRTDEDREAFLRDYMPLKFGSSLTSKLGKRTRNLRYWEHDISKGKPLVLAIADFHAEGDEFGPASMTYTQTALPLYLYGLRQIFRLEDGVLKIDSEKVESHTYGTKTAPSGFFSLPDAENISAVLFSNAGTISKFDRIGILAGFEMPGISYQRVGFRLKRDANSIFGEPFAEEVKSGGAYRELWGDEIQVFHNPNALYPLPMGALPIASHCLVEDGKLATYTMQDMVLGSFSRVFQVDDDEFAQVAT